MTQNENKFVRDVSTNALINTDISAFEEYKRNKKKEQRINSLENEVQEIKSILIKVLDRIEKNGN